MRAEGVHAHRPPVAWRTCAELSSLFLEALNLLQMIRAVSDHHAYVFRDGYRALEFRMVSGLVEVGGLQAAEQAQVVVTVQAVERHHLIGGGIHVPGIARPRVLVN